MFSDSFTQLSFPLSTCCANSLNLTCSSKHYDSHICLSKNIKIKSYDFEIDEPQIKIGISYDKDDDKYSVTMAPDIFGVKPSFQMSSDKELISQLLLNVFGFNFLIRNTMNLSRSSTLLLLSKLFIIKNMVIQSKVIFLPSLSASLCFCYNGFALLCLHDKDKQKTKIKARYGVTNKFNLFYEYCYEEDEKTRSKFGIIGINENHKFGLYSDFVKNSLKFRTVSKFTNWNLYNMMRYDNDNGISSSVGTKVYLKTSRIYSNLTSEKDFFLSFKTPISSKGKIQLSTKLCPDFQFDLSLSFDNN